LLHTEHRSVRDFYLFAVSKDFVDGHRFT
jgi:hypothetical protein